VIIAAGNGFHASIVCEDSKKNLVVAIRENAVSFFNKISATILDQSDSKTEFPQIECEVSLQNLQQLKRFSYQRKFMTSNFNSVMSSIA
jgi:hypothetical protein